MKKLYKSLFVLCMAFPFVSCEKDLPVYDYEECGLMFEYQYARDSTYSYSFGNADSFSLAETFLQGNNGFYGSRNILLFYLRKAGMFSLRLLLRLA